MLYLHIGMHKTGTTYMQRCVFPRFEGVQYIHSPILDKFVNLSSRKQYLGSNERLAGTLWASPSDVDHSIEGLSKLFPDARILMSFRPHHEYIISSYKQFLHEGGTKTFREYFDVVGNRGYLRKEQLYYRDRIQAVERYFGRAPFVFTLSEIKSNLDGLLRDLGTYMNARPPKAVDVSKTPRNRGVGYYQASILRRMNRYNRTNLNPAGRYRLSNYVTETLRVDPARVAQYWLSWLPKKDFCFNEEEFAILDRDFAEDWAFVHKRSKTRAGASMPGEHRFAFEHPIAAAAVPNDIRTAAE